VDFLFVPWIGTPLWLWLAFLAFVALLLILDLGVFNRRDHEIGVRESLLLSACYIGAGLAFGGWVWWHRGGHPAIDYLTGFVIEKSLAMDNIFVIAMIFSYFDIPRRYQHRVLYWGILGVIILRGLMIGLGVAMLARFAWLPYLFGAFLIFTGVRMWFTADRPVGIAGSSMLNWVRRRFPVTQDLHGHAFWVRHTDPQTGRTSLCMTPLFLSLLMIELADVMFAVDSVPAIFAITTDPFIVYTSNIFAVLGLRALYFALAAMIHRFRYLKYALAVLLVFIGAKVFAADALGIEKVPPLLSLGVTFIILGTGIAYSLRRTAPEEPGH